MIPLAWPTTVARDNFLVIPLFEGWNWSATQFFEACRQSKGLRGQLESSAYIVDFSSFHFLLLRVKEVCERPKTSSFLSVPLPVPSRNIGVSRVGTKSVFSRDSTHPIEKAGKILAGPKTSFCL